MKAGPLDRRLTIQHKTVTQNEFGEEVETWADLATVWCEMRDVSDGERVAAAEVAATITTRFRIRHSSTVADVNPGDDRLVFEGRIYDLWGVKRLGRREGLELTAAARAE
jgi:SPP1 family predicted phage head-tail adaptor